MENSYPKDYFFIRYATAIAITTVTILMAVAAVIFYIQGEASNYDEEMVMHTYQVTGHIQLLFNRIKDVELGQRGFIIEGGEEYLAPYYDAMKNSLGADAASTRLEQHHSIAEELAILKKLTKDNSIQLQNLDEMAIDIKELLDYWAASVKQRHDNREVTDQAFDFHHGNQLMDNVRRLVGIMMAEENRLLSSRIVTDAANTREHNILTFSGMAIFYIIMLNAIIFYRKTRRKTNIIQQQLIEKLAGLNELNNAMLSSATSLIIATDENGVVIAFNEAAEKSLGYTQQEIVGKQTPAIWHDTSEVIKRAAELNEECGTHIEVGLGVFTHKAKRDGSESHEWTFIRKDRSRFPVNLITTVLRDKSRNITGYLSIIEDITERKNAEKYSEILRTITLSANNEKTMEGILYSALRTIGEKMEWPLGHAYLRNETTEKMLSSHCWYIDKTKEQKFEEFIHVTNTTDVKIGEGFVGQVYKNKTAIWIEDIAQEKSFLKNKLFENGNIHAVFAFPVFVKGNIRCILEFFNENIIPENTGFLIILEMVANQLSRVIERQEAENALKLSEETFRSTIDNAPIGIALAETTGKWLQVNHAFCNIVGYSEQELVNISFQSLTHPDDLADTLICIKQILAKEITTYRLEKRYIHKNGHIIWILLNVSLTWNDDGTPKYFIAQIQDITTQKEEAEKRRIAVEELRYSEERLYLATTGTSDGLWDWNLVTNEVYYSPRFMQELGYAEKELPYTIDTFSNILMHPDDLKSAFSAVEADQKRLAPYNTEYRLRHKDGHYIWCNSRGKTVWDENDKPIRMTGFTTNIDNRKKFEEQREQLVAKLAESNTELERFAYVASHDMQEPLRMIANFGSLLGIEYSSKLDDDGREYIHIVTQSATRMQAMVNDLLEYARIGNSEARFTVIDGAEELGHVLENLSTAIQERNAIIKYDSLPKIHGNPVQFMSLLQNLIGNGLKYQEKNTTPVVHVAAQDQGDHWCFSIRDNGIGMPEEYVHQVFQPFKRLHTWEEYKGTGIGLAVCKKIVENHGGTIWVTSKQGEGSVFYFTIPKIKQEKI